jgi:hypothetical protein
MTILDFQSTPIPDDVTTPDVKPETQFEYSCEVCGKELFYSGRGRKPKYCDEHKKGNKGAKRATGTNAQLAAQATEALVQINNLVCVGSMVIGYHETAGAISDREAVFREQVYSALLTDAALCRSILRAGTTSGKISLAIAYAMLAASIVPVSIMEYKDKAETKRNAELEAQG